jgi:rSAM/selenodomain-associated transferase 2
MLDDIDRPEDLSILNPAEDQPQSPATPELSIIIPTLNEGPAISRTLGAIGRNPAIEVIVTDGGSSDDTCAQAKAWGAGIVHAPPGRARQMNRGAAEARGDFLLFLHADTILPPDFAAQIRNSLARPGVSAGAFRLKIEPELKGLHLIERLANFRSRVWQLPYGDQGLFLSAKLFRETGGFPEMPFMEDVAFIRKLRRSGKIALTPAAVVTSARRWEKVGVWRNTLYNQLFLTAYGLGVKPETLARWYRSKMTG